MTPTAYYNSSKLCWEVWIEEAQGDRVARVLKSANTAHRMLKEQGYRFVDAKLGVMDMPILLITDYGYYTENESDMLEWCRESNVRLNCTGMILEFGSKEDKMMFMLRWQ